MLTIKKAVVDDVKEIHRFINAHAKRGQMLPRSLNELYENIRDLYLAEEDGKLLGVCALHCLWEDLAEIRSLVVTEEARQKGIGKKLVARCLTEAKKLGVKRVFALTYVPGFFHRLGFRDIDKAVLPQKIWGDCLKCHKFPECDEFAVIREL